MQILLERTKNWTEGKIASKFNIISFLVLSELYVFEREYCYTLLWSKFVIQ